MTFSLRAIFQRDDQYEGVRRINIYLLRLVFILMFFVLGRTLGRISSLTRDHGNQQMPWRGASGQPSRLWRA